MNRNDDGDIGDGSADDLSPGALYARYADTRGAEARARTAAARVVAALDETRVATGDAALEAAADGSPEGLYRRYRASRTAEDGKVPASTVDAIMAALQAESASATATAPEAAAAAGPAPRSASESVSERASEPARGSALGTLFRWPGAVLDRALGAIGDIARGTGRPALMPALALAAVAVAVVPFVLRDAADPAPDAGTVAFVPADLFEAPELTEGAYAPDAGSGVGFAGGDPLARAYRVGIALTDLVLASRGGEAGRELAAAALRFEAGADGDAAVAREVEALVALAVPGTGLDVLGGAADAVREALAAGDARVAARADLGRVVESARVAATLAREFGTTVPLERTLDALAALPPGEALPPRAAAALERLVALAGRPSLGSADGIEVAREADRLRLLLG